ncbi:hypothetical protein AB6735_09350 [Mucilaginibacter sp. RCC_168]
MMETTQRQTYLDWLRILSIAGVLFFHSAMPTEEISPVVTLSA